MTDHGPTLVLHDGRLADDAVRRLTEALGGDTDGRAVLPAAAPAAELDATLDALMRVARPGQGAGPRLDLWLLADRTRDETAPEPLARVVARIAERVAARLGAVFPASAPPEQRAAALHVVVATRALDASAGPVLGEVGALHEASLVHPVLARTWLVAQRTPGGVLGEDDVAAGLAGLLLALSFSGLRDHEAVRQRLAHPAPGEGPIHLAAVAVQDLPVGRLRAYARALAAWEGLDTLRRRALPRGHAGVGADRAVAGWQLEGWLQPLVDGPAAKAWRESAGRGDVARVEHAERSVDEAERAALTGVDGVIRDVLHGRWGHARPLEGLPELEQAVDAEQRRIEASWAMDAPGAPPPATPVTPAAPVERPPVDLRAHRAPLAAALGWLVAAAALGWLATPPPPVTGMSATVITSTAAPPAPSLVAGWALVAGAVAALAAWGLLGRAPGPPPPLTSAPAGDAAEIEPRLRQARLRVRRAALLGLARLRERVAIVRAALDEARARVATALDAVGARPDGTMERDLPAVLGPTGALHDHLLDAGAVAAWLRRGRRFADPEAWADELASATWPAEGLVDDAPAADPAGVARAAAAQVAPLDVGSPFDDEPTAEAAADRARAFLGRVAPALQRPCTPVGPSGDPVAGIRPGDALVLVPFALRAVLDTTLRRDGVPLPPPLPSPAVRPAVVVLRTWEALPLDAVRRGSGIR